MVSDFFLGRGWKTMLLLNAVAPGLMAASFVMVADLRWWRIALGLALVASSAYNAVVFRRAIQTPLISLRPDALLLRNMQRREVTQIRRSEIAAVEWANTASICFRLQSGELQAMHLMGLSRKDKDTLLAQFETQRNGA
jgi:hypothetical protein